MKRPKFVVYKAADGYRWRLVAANGRIVATGEAHTRRRDAERAAAHVAVLAYYADQPLRSANSSQPSMPPKKS